jgi:DNA-directed RNA polymerase specialized sigma24 family protein
MKKKKKIRPQQVDENELLKVIDIITKKLAYKFKFGYHDIEDMKQQISIFALEGLKNYDHKRPLENFLWTHVRNRLFNYKRDNYQRPDKPCYTCPLYDKASKLCTKYSNKNDCDLYSKWLERNQSKKNLMHLTTVNELKDYSNIFFDSSATPDQIETLQIIENNLSGEYRTIYLKLKNGTKVTKAEKNKLLIKIREILCQKNEDN